MSSCKVKHKNVNACLATNFVKTIVFIKEYIKEIYRGRWKLTTAVKYLSTIGIATKGRGLEPPLCDKCDVIFSSIYTNTTKLILQLSYWERLDGSLNAFDWWVIALKLLFWPKLLQNNYLAKICIKMCYFIKKLQKSLNAGGSAPQTEPLASGGFAPRPSAFDGQGFHS